MQFNILLISAFAAVALGQSIVVGNNPLCKPQNDCCYAGADGGLKGCENQISHENCAQSNYRAAMCFNHGVKPAQCNADCDGYGVVVGITTSLRLLNLY
ncbi:hypothetical protein VTL71DRAFT_7239 [Oculimacula yallundae]|uniref:Uncharacterized protein n=1 Tax=Oculimacula yallundae TaxID=86028 RepID=A0ABR4BXL5_9HELO